MTTSAPIQTGVVRSGVAEEQARALRMYRRMLAIRLFEERVNDLYTRALMPGLAHLYSGEEAVAVGVCEALHRDDYITSTHRGHGHCLAKGAAPDRMFAELLGKEAGYCKGKGGSMHIADPDTGNLGANAIVGGQRGHRHRRCVFLEAIGQRPRRGVFLRRGRAGARGDLRSDEHGGGVEAARDLRVREQPVQRVHAHSETTAGDLLVRAGGFGVLAEAWTGRMRARSTRSWRSWSSGRGAARVRRLCGPTRIASPGTTWAISAASIIAPSRKSSCGKASAIRMKVMSAWLIENGVADAAALDQMRSRRSRRKWKKRCSSRWPLRIRMRRKSRRMCMPETALQFVN